MRRSYCKTYSNISHSQTSQTKDYHSVDNVEANLQKQKASMVKVQLLRERPGNGRPQKICKYFLLIDTARLELCLFPVQEEVFDGFHLNAVCTMQCR